MKRTKLISLLLSALLVVFTAVPIEAAEPADLSADFAMETVATEEEEKLLRFNAYKNEDGTVGLAIEIVKEEIWNRGELHLSFTLPDSKEPVYNDVFPEELFGTAIQNLLLDREYHICLKQRDGDTEYLYHGFLSVADSDGVLGCESHLWEETQPAMEYLEGALGISQADSPDGGVLVPYSSFLYESEPNNSTGTADVIQDDDTMYGLINPGDESDWYRIQFVEYGQANFWLGDIPSGCDYDFEVYDGSGSYLWGSYGTTEQEQIYNKTVYPDRRYYLRVYGAGAHRVSTSRYRVRARVFDPVETEVCKYRFAGNLSNIKYHLDRETLAQDVNYALSDWRSPTVGTNKIGTFTKTNDIDQAQIIFMPPFYEDDKRYGQTELYATVWGAAHGGGKVDPDQANWLAARIYLFYDNIERDKNTMDYFARGIVSHEMGHFFGLAHTNSNPYSIMCELTATVKRKVINVRKPDNDAFNRKYP